MHIQVGKVRWDKLQHVPSPIVHSFTHTAPQWKQDHVHSLKLTSPHYLCQHILGNCLWNKNPIRVHWALLTRWLPTMRVTMTRGPSFFINYLQSGNTYFLVEGWRFPYISDHAWQILHPRLSKVNSVFSLPPKRSAPGPLSQSLIHRKDYLTLCLYMAVAETILSRLLMASAVTQESYRASIGGNVQVWQATGFERR